MLELIIFIIIIVVAIKSKNKKEKNKKSIEDYWEEEKTITNNLYQPKEKNQQNHEKTSDMINEIGYKRCPKCQNLISKKSKTCFMCNYNFENNKKTEKNVENK